MTLREHLTGLGACAPALKLIGNHTAAEVWAGCQEPSWLYWWARRTDANREAGPLPWRRYAASALEIAESVGHLVRPGELRPAAAVAAGRAYLADPTPANLDALRQARRAAYAAAAYAATDAAYAAYAASASAASASAASASAAYASAASASAASASAASASAASAAAASADDARARRNIQSCEIIRRHLVCPWTETGATSSPIALPS